MGCCAPGDSSNDCQQWPASSGNIIVDPELSVLKSLENVEKGRVDSYILSTVHLHNGYYVQKGCGPNFEGDLLTQCTCRHDLRARTVPNKWVGNWIAGFTYKNMWKSDEHYLIYLFKVDRAVDSFKKLFDLYDDKLRIAKSSVLNRCGDLHVPVHEFINDEWSIDCYEHPRRDHVHQSMSDRRKDIESTYYGRHPSLLIGEKFRSYLWRKPKIMKNVDFSSHKSGQKYDSFEDFLNDLLPI